MDYNFTVEYIHGSHNKAADSFSRHPVDSPDESKETHGEMQTLFLRMCRLSQAQMTDCPFRLERIRNATKNDLEYQLLKTQVRQGFPENKHELNELIHPYWNVCDDLLISDDDFVLKGTRLVNPANLRKHVLADLHASYRGIEGTKARARLLVYWPGIDNDITNTCKSCLKCEFDRTSNVKEPMQHLPVATHAFQIISADWIDLTVKNFWLL